MATDGHYRGLGIAALKLGYAKNAGNMVPAIEMNRKRVNTLTTSNLWETKMKINSKFITVNGKRAGVYYSPGPWIAGVDPTTIKITPKQYSFPAEFQRAFAIENNSDGMTDYFERDSIRITSTHPLYAQVKAASDQANAHRAR